MTAEAAAADQEWMAGLAAWLEELLVDDAMGDDALDVALCAEIAARIARRQAAERLRLEDVMRAEAKKVSLPWACPSPCRYPSARRLRCP